MTYRLDQIPKDEMVALRSIARAGGEAVQEPLYRYAVIRARKTRKAAMNAQSDRKRRTLVGARVPQEEAWLIKRAADLSGLSIYAFCRKALREAANSTISTTYVENEEAYPDTYTDV